MCVCVCTAPIFSRRVIELTAGVLLRHVNGVSGTRTIAGSGMATASVDVNTIAVDPTLQVGKHWGINIVKI